MSEESYTTATSTAISIDSISNQTTAHNLSIYAVAGILLAVVGVCLLSGGIVFLMWRFDRLGRPRSDMLSEIPISELDVEVYAQHFSHFSPAQQNADVVASKLQRPEMIWDKHDDATNESAGPLQFPYERQDCYNALTPPDHNTQTNANHWAWAPLTQHAQPLAPIPVTNSTYLPVSEAVWNNEPETSCLLPQSATAEPLDVVSNQRMSKQWTCKENASDVLTPDGDAECIRHVAPGGPYNYSLLVHGRNPSYKGETPVALTRADSITQSYAAGISRDYTASSVALLSKPLASPLSSKSQVWTTTNPSDCSTNRLKMLPPENAYSPLRPQPLSGLKINIASSQQLCERDSSLPSQKLSLQHVSEMISKTPQLNSIRGKRSTPPAALQLTLKRSKAVRRKYSEDSPYLSAVVEVPQPQTSSPPTSLSTTFYSHTATPYQFSPVYTSPSSAGLSGSSSRHSGSSFYSGITELTPTTPAMSGFGYATTAEAPMSQPCVE
ncbi:hypothetical protein MMC27_002575 [Xylographa pallens]|nr:hypothetical protein [Xylographa pallens]